MGSKGFDVKKRREGRCVSQIEKQAGKAGCKKAMCAMLPHSDSAPLAIKNNAGDFKQADSRIVRSTG